MESDVLLPGAPDWLGCLKARTSDRGLQPGRRVEASLCDAGYAEPYFCLFRGADELHGETGFSEAMYVLTSSRQPAGVSYVDIGNPQMWSHAPYKLFAWNPSAGDSALFYSLKPP